MRKIFFLMCVVLSLCSCASSETKLKKAECQELCDSLNVSEQLQSWVVIESVKTSWVETKNQFLMVGKVPVNQKRKHQVQGCMLLMENGQQILTKDYLNVPVGTVVVQRYIYGPEEYEDNGTKNYRPCVKSVEHYLLLNDKVYPLEHFEIF